MIILLKQDAGPSAVRSVLASLGIPTDEVRLGGREALVADGRESPLPAGSIARIEGVDRVIPLSPAAPLAHATRTAGGRVVQLGSVGFGGGGVAVVAGPCSVEDGAALRRTARLVKDAGANALRGGIFKTRTSPHNYQGGGLDALRELHAVSREVGLPFFTELTDPRQVEQVGDVVDAVQIGARHMQNFPLIIEVARLGKPVLLKRHMAADVDEWLLAAEYVLKEGNEQLILCERGVKTTSSHVRFLLDLGVVPYLKARIGMPVLVDPSHAAGRYELVPALARAAIAAGADGLLVEVHPEPETTRCDAAQALPPDRFARLMEEVRALEALRGLEPETPAARVGQAAGAC